MRREGYGAQTGERSSDRFDRLSFPAADRRPGLSIPRPTLRLIALRKSAAATEVEQARVRHEARAKHHQVDARSLQAAQFIYLLTDLSAARLEAAQALELYRLRWQIEIAFKRLKGLLHLDHLRAKDPRLAATDLYAKLLGALLLDELYRQAEAFFPWGFALFGPAAQPLAALADAP